LHKSIGICDVETLDGVPVSHLLHLVMFQLEQVKLEVSPLALCEADGSWVKVNKTFYNCKNHFTIVKIILQL
jgi:hypothetical protein